MGRKRWSNLGPVLLLLMVVMSGCQKGADTGETKGTSDIPLTGEEKAAEAKIDPSDYPSFIALKRELNEETFEYHYYGKVDLDMDGKEEQLNFHSDRLEYLDEGIHIERKQFLINDEVVDLQSVAKPIWKEWMDQQAQEIGSDDPTLQTVFHSIDVIDLDPTDGKRELLVYKTLPNYGPPLYMAEAFHYVGGQLVSLGEMDTRYTDTMGETEEIPYKQAAVFDPQNRSVSFYNDGFGICCFYYTETYQLQEGRMVCTTKEEKEIFLTGENGKEPIISKVISTAKIYRSPQWDEVTYELVPGDEVTLLSTIPGKWVKVRVSNGRIGYLKHVWKPADSNYDYDRYVVDDDEEKGATDVFEDLPFWG